MKTSFVVQFTTAFECVSVLLNTLSEVERSPVPSFQNRGFSLKPFWIIMTTVRIRNFSTLPKKGIFLNPTRGFAIVPTREFLFVSTSVISFFASLHHSISRTGKSLNTNKTHSVWKIRQLAVNHSPRYCLPFDMFFSKNHTCFQAICSIPDLLKEIRRKQHRFPANGTKVVKPVLTSWLHGFCKISLFWLDRTLISIVYTNDDSIVPTATAKAWP